tara:strand:+ start:2450 stop:9397 length:6948 start_codon:yes stop_codon:yes gene_type:complete
MDELEQLYGLMDSNGLTGGATVDDFRNADDSQRKQLYDLLKANKIDGGVDYDTFSSAWDKKKSIVSDSTSQNQDLGSEAKNTDGSSATANTIQLTDEQVGITKPKTNIIDNLLERKNSETSISENDIQDVNNTLEKESKGDFGFFGNIKNAITSVPSIGAIPNPFYSPENYGNNKKYIEVRNKIASEQNIKPNEVNQDVLKKTVLDERKNELLKQKKEAKTENFIETLTTEEQKQLNEHFNIKSDKLKSKNKGILIENEGLKKQADTYASELENISNELKNIKLNHDETKQYPEEYYSKSNQLVEKYNQIVEKLKDTQKTYETNINNFNDSKEDLLSVEEEIDLFKRNYSWLDNFTGKLSNASKELLINLDYGAEKLNFGLPTPLELVGAKLGYDVKDLKNKKTSEIRNDIETSKETLRKSKDLGSMDLNVENITEWALDLVSEQAPNTVLMAATGGASLPLMGLSTGGGKFYQLEQEEKNSLGAIKYSDFEKYASAFITGTAEALSEKISLGQISKAKRVFSSATKKELKDNTVKYLKNQLPEYFKDIVQEGGSESVSQLAENITDKYLLGKDISLTYGLTESFISGAFMSGVVYKAPGIAKGIVDVVTPKDVNQKIGENFEQVLKINQELQKDLLPNTKTALENKKEILINENKKLVDKTISNVDNLSSKEKGQLLAIQNETFKLRKEAKTIIEDNLDESTKKELVKDINNNIQELATKKESILNPKDAKTEEATVETQEQAVETVTPDTETKGNEKGVENKLSDKSVDDLEKRQFEIEDSKNDKEEFNAIDKELEKREWQSVLNSPINEVESIIDGLIKKEKDKPNGFGSYIEKRDARETKEIAKKYQGEVDIKTAKKDFKDAFFGNPSTWYADGLKLKESTRAFIEQGGTFKELLSSVQKEFESDGFSEQDAAGVINKKLSEISKTNETTPKPNTNPNADVQPNIEQNIQQGKDNAVQPTVEPKASTGTTKVEDDIAHAVKEVNKGVLAWDSNPFSPRVDLGISRADVRKGEADIKKGNYNSVPAKRVIEALNKAKEQGFYDYMQGSGGQIEKLQVPLTEQLDAETELTVQELEEINANEEKLAKESIEWFDALDENTQNEILDNYENKTNEFGKVQENPQKGQGKVDVQDKQKPKQTKDERVKLANAKIDDIANAIKGIDEIFGIKIKIDDVNGVTKNGIDMVNVIASIVKKAVEAGINIDVAIQKTIEHFKKTIDFEIDPNDVKAKLEPTKGQEVKDNFRDKIKDLPNSGMFSKYMSGETIKREHTGELTNEQDIEVQVLTDAGNHGIETIELAKEQFGDKYVEKILEYLEDSTLKLNERAVLYVSLENEMDNRVKNNPENVGDKKLQDLVRAKSQQLLREASLSINAGRLRALMRDGYITDPITNKMYSSEQLEGKKKIQKAIEANADRINEEAEYLENEPDFEIKEPRTKRSKTVVKNDIKNTLSKLRADLLRVAKGDVAMVSVPYAAQLKVAAPHIIKLSKLLTELGGMKTREIIDEIHSQIKDVFSKIKKSDIEDILRENNKPKTRNKIDPKVKQAKQLVKEALIEKGFSRDINVRVNEKDELGRVVKDKNGRNKKVKERRTILDWKKLAGEAGSVDNIRENVQDALKGKGYTDSEIKNMGKLLEDEYNNLRASVIEKSLNELNRRNEIRKKVNIKSSAKRLAELFNYGLFEKEADTYNNLINSALGFNDLDNKSFRELESLAKTLANLYGQGKSEIGLQEALASVNKDIARTLNKAAFASGNNAYKTTAIAQEYINLSTRFMLVTMNQALQNPISGYIQRAITSVGYALDKTDNKKLAKQRKFIAKDRFKSIVREGGGAYGDASSLLINDSKIENWLNDQSENELYHSAISFGMGRAFLEGFDSRHKTVLTEKYFIHNLIKILSDPSNTNKMSKAEALNFVTEKLTGESFEKAKIKAKSITEKINKDAGKKILNNTDRAINIFAQGIMKDALLEGKVLSEDEISAAYNAAYKVAGRDIGHVANNMVSKMVGGYNSRVDSELQQAIKEKDWNKAALKQTEQILSRNILNTFVGGGTNWYMLGLQYSPLGLPQLVYSRYMKGKNSIDLTTTKGMKNLEETLYRSLDYKNTAARILVGSTVQLVLAGIFMASGYDDDMDEYIKNNPLAKKYFNLLAPTSLIAILAYKNGDMSSFFKKLFNNKSQVFDINYKASKAVADLVSDKPNKGAEAGKLLGSYLNAPLPYRLTSDIKDIYRYAMDEPIPKKSYKASGFWNGFFMGGLVDKVGLRPGADQEVLDMQEKMDKRRSRPQRPSREEAKQKREKKIENEAELRKEAERLGVKYVPPRR